MGTTNPGSTISLSLEFTKPFSDAVGKKELDYGFKGITVRDLLKELSLEYPKLRSMFYADAGTITEYLMVFVNSKPLSAFDGTSTKLSDGDRLVFIFPVSGG